MGKDISHLFNIGKNNANQNKPNDASANNSGSKKLPAFKVGNPQKPTQQTVPTSASENAGAEKEKENKPDISAAQAVSNLAQQAVPEKDQPAPSLIGVSESLTISTDDFNHPDQIDSFTQQQMQAIRNSLDVLKQNIDDKNIVSDAIRNVLLTTKQYPEVAELLEDEDIRIMTRGLKASYGAVLTVKKGNKEKRTQKAQNVDEAMAALQAFNFNTGV